MNRDRWARVRDVFQQAVELEPAEQDVFVRQACGADDGLEQDIRRLLTADRAAGDFLERPFLDTAGEVVVPDDDEAAVAELSSSIADYQLLRQCGQGAFGEVWVVRDRVGALRAMKVLELYRLEHLGLPEREATALGHYCRRIPRHSNLVQIFHVGQGERLFYYTMELADDVHTGRAVRQHLPDDYRPMTLATVLARGPVRLESAVEIGLRLLAGLTSIHQAGLVHRDIKPANILFVDRQIKLADISLVNLARSEMSKAGTPSYMPPDDRMDATADTYAVGKVLYELVCGRDRDCFPGLKLEAIGPSAHIDIRKLDAFLRRACATLAQDRFASAAEMRSALLDCRYPVEEELLLELADREARPLDGDAGREMDELQRAVSEFAHLPSRKSPGSLGPLSSSDDRVLWATIDRLIRILPWIVILVLGYILIYRLTR